MFTTTSAYTAPFQLAVAQPVDGSYGVSTTAPLTFKLSNAVDPTTVAGALTLEDAAGNPISGSISYDDSEHTLTFTPSISLAASTTYTARVKSNLQDIFGTALAPATVTFTTGTALASNINQGLGGPVLVLTDPSYPYGTYLAEILRTMGINYFTVKDVSQLSAGLLNQYKLVLLARSALATGQVTALTNWVQAGGNLIAMRPDKDLAGLLGLTATASTLSEGYLKIDTTKAPGQGIIAETMQYHGIADKYTANAGVQMVATLFSDAATATSYPAVTERTFGSGQVAAFTYNLPKSIALTHQGNPAWAGQDRDGDGFIRPDDLFASSTGTPWLNVNKAYIPQADEQQRLLINMMLDMTRDDTPLPRFWILPHGLKSALVMTMDDHNTPTGSWDVFNDVLNYSATNCSLLDWQCQRSGSLLFTIAGLTSAQADKAHELGFALGSHVNWSNSTGCAQYASYSDLSVNWYDQQIADFKTKYPNLPNQTFDRVHCYVWSDWDSVPKADVAHGLRINYNYEWYPASFTGSNSGYLTGSGLSMRFTDVSGQLIDTYQGVTDLDYENDPTTAMMAADLDNTINSNGFYGVIGTHFDTSSTNYYKQLIAAATSRHIPMISAAQLATWKDGLNSSSFANLSSTKYRLDFTIKVAQGGVGMQAMIPSTTANGAIASLTRAGAPVSYTTSTVKGVNYAVFDARPGNYTVLYGTQPTPPPPPADNGDGSFGPTESGATGSNSNPSSSSPSVKDMVIASASSALDNAGQPRQPSITNPEPFADDDTTITPPPNSTTGQYGSPEDNGGWKLVVIVSSVVVVAALLIWWLLAYLRRDARGQI